MQFVLLLVTALLGGSFQKIVESATSERRIVCYMNSGNFKRAHFKFHTSDIDPFLCTHIIYAFIKADVEKETLVSIDPVVDMDLGGLRNITELKKINQNLKVMVSVGGWNEGSEDFSKIASTKEKRDSFVANSIKYLRQYNFDGLDIDWQYPAQRKGGVPQDLPNYAALIKEFSEAFHAEANESKKPQLLLSLVISALEGNIEGFNISTVNKYTDFVNLISYEYFTSSSPFVNHHAPLYPIPQYIDDPINSKLCGDASVRHLLKIGMSPERINFGIPTYARVSVLEDSDEYSPGSSAAGEGSSKSTQESEWGYSSYVELCRTIDDWEVIRDYEPAWGPYAHKGNRWMSYEDPQSTADKAKYAFSMNLGGLMFWTIDHDDFYGTCHNNKYPLIRAARQAFLPIPPRSVSSTTTEIGLSQETVHTTPSTTRTVGSSSSTSFPESATSAGRTSTKYTSVTSQSSSRDFGESASSNIKESSKPLFGKDNYLSNLPLFPGGVFIQNIENFYFNIFGSRQ